jgi:menaquinone-dependent protoporphyrinogen IX oxidase
MNTACSGTTACIAGSLMLAFASLVPAGEPAAPQVLIATETSKFKDAVAAEVAEALRRDGYAVNIIPLDRLAAEPTGKYRAIVLVNTCHAWRPGSEARSFLRKASGDEKKKLVVLTTANSEECDLKVSGVDAISAASKNARRPVVTRSILDKLRARLAIP